MLSVWIITNLWFISLVLGHWVARLVFLSILWCTPPQHHISICCNSIRYYYLLLLNIKLLFAFTQHHITICSYSTLYYYLLCPALFYNGVQYISPIHSPETNDSSKACLSVCTLVAANSRVPRLSLKMTLFPDCIHFLRVQAVWIFLSMHKVCTSSQIPAWSQPYPPSSRCLLSY